MENMETLIFERQGNVGWLRLNRPQRHNAMTIQLWTELAELGQELVNDDSLRALVVIGNGKSFSSGIDLSSFAGAGGGGGLFADAGSGGEPGGSGDTIPAKIEKIQAGYTWLQTCGYPTIAAVRGHALGGGCQLALACDLRIASPTASFALPEHRYGLLPDLGGTYFLTQLVGPAKAKELIWTNGVLDAAEAHRLGIVQRLVDDDEGLEDAARRLAESIAAAPPLAVRGTKRLVDEAAHALPMDEALHNVALAQSACIRAKDFIEAMAALGEKRAPEYHGH